jgi:hypothetical protein
MPGPFNRIFPYEMISEDRRIGFFFPFEPHIRGLLNLIDPQLQKEYLPIPFINSKFLL